MKQSRCVTIYLVLLILCTIACITNAKSKDETHKASSRDISSKENDAIELNPEYEDQDEAGGISKSPGQEDDDDDGEEDDDDEKDGDDDDDEKDVVHGVSAKAKVESALRKTKRRYSKYAKLIKKNRRSITLALAVFAFRREIRALLVHIVTHEIMDPKTGQLRVSPTSLLKFLLFVDVLRRFQSGRNASQPSFQALAQLGESNPIMGLFFARVLRVPMFNPAFLPPISQHYTFERINERYLKDGMALHKAIHAKHEDFKWPTADSAITRSMISANRLPPIPASNETVIVVDMTNLDTSLTTMDHIRDQVSFLLSNHRTAAMMMHSPTGDKNATPPEELLPTAAPPLEIIVLLESPGGSAADYGLAAQQLLRLRQDPGIVLTICVDKVAASGGYMMACTASPGHLFAAPFAVVGSIGVLGQIVNAQKLLEGWGLSPLVFRGGKDKAPLGIIGEVTQEGKDKTQAIIDVTHEAFQQHVMDARPILRKNIKKVGTGEIFIGKGALDAGLIDKITTSDEYITSKVASGARVLKLVKNRKARFPFASNFDNYDTTLGVEQRPTLSIASLLMDAWRSTANYFGLGTDMSVESMRQAVSVVHQSPKLCAK